MIIKCIGSSALPGLDALGLSDFESEISGLYIGAIIPVALLTIMLPFLYFCSKVRIFVQLLNICTASNVPRQRAQNFTFKFTLQQNICSNTWTRTLLHLPGLSIFKLQGNTGRRPAKILLIFYIFNRFFTCIFFTFLTLCTHSIEHFWS